MFIRRYLPVALFAALSIAGSTAGAAIATNSHGNRSTVELAQPTHGATAQLDRYFGPVITGVSPDSGPTTGGTAVTITGEDFTVVTQVAFGGVPTSYTIVSSTEIIATSPPESAGTVTVHMGDLAGPVPTVGEFTYS
jgi:IPT/TIG domain